MSPDTDESLPHLGVVGDTYTILVSGADTAGRYTLIDMYVPSGGGPPPHRHDFEEMFTVLDGEIELTFRGVSSVATAGDTINVPANAPHAFRNVSERPARLLCLCTPAGQEEFFKEVGVPVAHRTEAPPALDDAATGAFIAKAIALAPKYRTELLLDEPKPDRAARWNSPFHAVLPRVLGNHCRRLGNSDPYGPPSLAALVAAASAGVALTARLAAFFRR